MKHQIVFKYIKQIVETASLFTITADFLINFKKGVFNETMDINSR